MSKVYICPRCGKSLERGSMEREPSGSGIFDVIYFCPACYHRNVTDRTELALPDPAAAKGDRKRKAG